MRMYQIAKTDRNKSKITNKYVQIKTLPRRKRICREEYSKTMSQLRVVLCAWVIPQEYQLSENTGTEWVNELMDGVEWNFSNRPGTPIVCSADGGHGTVKQRPRVVPQSVRIWSNIDLLSAQSWFKVGL